MPALPQVSRLSLKNILFPTDFSPASSAALPYAETLAQMYGSTIVFVHSLPPEPRRPVVMDRVPPQDDRVWQDARQRIEEFAHAMAGGSGRQKTLIDQGDLAVVIPAIIHEQEVDLVVLGTHGRRGMNKLLLGSSAEMIYRSASCPVLTVGPHVEPRTKWELHRILCPVDIAEDTSMVLQYALSLAEENQAQLIVLEADPLVPWQHRSSIETEARLRLEALIPEQARDWCTLQCVVRWEHPVEAILHEAKQSAADLIVMSVRRSRLSSWSAHMPWPIASEVVSRATCPVLTVRV